MPVPRGQCPPPHPPGPLLAPSPGTHARPAPPGPMPAPPPGSLPPGTASLPQGLPSRGETFPSQTTLLSAARAPKGYSTHLETSAWPPASANDGADNGTRTVSARPPHSAASWDDEWDTPLMVSRSPVIFVSQAFRVCLRSLSRGNLRLGCCLSLVPGLLVFPESIEQYSTGVCLQVQFRNNKYCFYVRTQSIL